METRYNMKCVVEGRQVISQVSRYRTKRMEGHYQCRDCRKICRKEGSQNEEETDRNRDEARSESGAEVVMFGKQSRKDPKAGSFSNSCIVISCGSSLVDHC